MLNKTRNIFLKIDSEICSTQDIILIETWFSIRYELFYNCISLRSKKPPKKPWKKIFSYFLNLIHILKIPFLIKKKDILIVDVGRYKYYKSQINDPISQSLQSNNLEFNLLSIANNNFFLKNQINISFFIKIINIFLNKKKLPKNVNKNFIFIKEKIKKYLPNKKIDFNYIRSNIYNYQISILIIISFFIKLLKPKYVIYHEIPSLLPLIKYCNQNNIITIDIQHSMVSKLNILYQFNIKKIYSYLLTKKIFIWGKYWKVFFSNNKRCLVAGNFDYYPPFKNISKEKVITIISSDFSRQKLLKLCKQLVEDFTDYKIIYKLRPDEVLNQNNLDSRLRNCKNFIIFKEKSAFELQDVLNKSEYIIGTNSTLLIESIGKSNIIVYKIDWFEEYSDLIKKKFFLSAKNYFDLYEIIKKKKKSKRTNSNLFFEKFFNKKVNYIFNKL